jgi:large subunit ribosomal protein L9
MEIILKQEVQNLGSKDEIVKVKPGYARNYLIPQGLAVSATESAKKMLSENLKQRAHKEAKILEDMQAIAAQLGGKSFKVGAKAGENGKIFGSVNTIQLADALKEDGYKIDRKQISIREDSIKQLGTYKASIKLHKEVSVEIDFEVVSE